MTGFVHSFPLFLLQILKAVAGAINFTLDFYQSDDAAVDQWGEKTPNGSYTGLIGEIVRKRPLVVFK